jgi:prepilin-type N-terminal cleavage/methylation domain-containing protein
MTNQKRTFSTQKQRLPKRKRRGFSLLELIVVISITTLLMGLLMPALSSVRENAMRVICGANQRQFGQALTMYSADHRNRLPIASVLDLPEPDPTLLSLVRSGLRETTSHSHFSAENFRKVPEPLTHSDWDGLGHLYKWHYCGSSESYYCPSHEGNHTHEECKGKWDTQSNDEPMYANYQYVGHKDWRTGAPRSLLQGNKLILVTDSMRTKADFNHGVGYNELRGDGSVSWKDNVIVRTQLSAVAPADFDEMRTLDDLIYIIFSK